MSAFDLILAKTNVAANIIRQGSFISIKTQTNKKTSLLSPKMNETNILPGSIYCLPPVSSSITHLHADSRLPPVAPSRPGLPFVVLLHTGRHSTVSAANGIHWTGTGSPDYPSLCRRSSEGTLQWHSG